jgi:hypothetical protein
LRRYFCFIYQPRDQSLKLTVEDHPVAARSLLGSPRSERSAAQRARIGLNVLVPIQTV